ncbi:BTB/POZ domain-containing protein [Hibiscus syriacus]|uniref:BTB/POZ domain-containing protein n=1 Tax=Hibiscus syriacus TaxID=106335 RepID=A0A6A3AEV7_HIBSY|nr:BTB/POZ domain-containing protein [Hibiscus syriacus]
MEKHQHHLQQLSLAKSSGQRRNEWIFRDVPSDITIYVNGVTFALHKFPLVSRSGRIRKLVAEHRGSDIPKVELMNLPGGVESFELAAKFCYGINFEVTSLNVARLRCNLEMCVEVLQQCEDLLPLADELKIVGRCIDKIASKACVEQTASSFSQLEYIDSGRLRVNREAKCEDDWWIEDLSVIRINLYQRVIIAMKRRSVHPKSIGASLVNYVQKELTKKVDSISTEHERLVIETIISLLPNEKLAVPDRISVDIATLDYLLIPSFRHGCETLFEVDTVHRILVNFSQQDDCVDDMDDVSIFESDSPHSSSALLKVLKVVDNYLAEIAPDAKVKFAQFMAIAEALPAHARTINDGLYRAIDIYLKAHQGILEVDKKKLCKLIDFQKLSQEAGAHAAQNERLPLQSTIQSAHHHQSRWISSGALSAVMSPGDNYASLRREKRELKLELSRIRMRLNDLEKEHVYMKRNMARSHSDREAVAD